MAAKSLGEAIMPIIKKRLDDGTFKLPAMPATALRVGELLQKEDIDSNAVVRTLEKDPILAAQVVRAANTVAFRGRATATNLQQAVVRLGSRQLRSFLVTAVAHQVFVSRDRDLDEALKSLRMHSVATSLLARDLAQLARCEEIEETYLTGLLHDIGKVVLLIFIMEVARMQKSGRTQMRVHPEDYQAALKEFHMQVTERLLVQWDIPLHVQQSIFNSARYSTVQRVNPGNLVCFANAMTKKLKISFGETPPAIIATTLMVGRSLLGIDEELVDRVCIGLEERVKEM